MDASQACSQVCKIGLSIVIYSLLNMHAFFPGRSVRRPVHIEAASPVSQCRRSSMHGCLDGTYSAFPRLGMQMSARFLCSPLWSGRHSLQNLLEALQPSLARCQISMPANCAAGMQPLCSLLVCCFWQACLLHCLDSHGSKNCAWYIPALLFKPSAEL